MTPEVKAKFTEKLRRDPTEFDGIKVAEVRELAGLNSSSATDHGYGIVATLPALGRGVDGVRVNGARRYWAYSREGPA